MIDLRSDVISKAPEEMLKALQNTHIRNNYNTFNFDDPTCIAFEEQMAQMFGKEQSLVFVSSTMANLAAVLLHTTPGNEIIVASTAHAVERQSGSYAMIAGVQTRQVNTLSGLFTAADIKHKIRKIAQNLTFPDTSLIFLENGTLRGRAWPVNALQEIKKLAQQTKTSVHIDGARIFNALAHYKLAPKDISHCYNTMTVCLSKGLACPIGAVLLGSHAEILKLKSIRKGLGGCIWHPAFISQPGTYAIKHILPQIPKDNQMAKLLATELAKIEEINVKPEQTELNMVYWSVKLQDFNHKEFQDYLLKNNIKIKPFDAYNEAYRFVTHYAIREKQIDSAVKVIKEYFSLLKTK